MGWADKRWGVVAALALGLGATLWGLAQHGAAMLTPLWTPHHLGQAQWVLGLGAAIFLAGVLARRFAVSLALLLGVAVVAFGAGTVLAVGLLVLAAWLLGWAALRLFDPSAEPEPLMALCAGVALLVLVLPALGVADMDMRPVFLAVVAGGLGVLFAPGARASLLGLWRGLLAAPAPPVTRWFALWLITAWFVFALAHASLPERKWDVFAMHLMVPNQIVTFGRWAHPPSEMAFAVFPMGANYLFAFAMQLGGEQAVHLLNLSAMLGILALTRDILRSFCGAAMQDVALLMLLGTPLVFALSVIPLVENTLTFLVVAAVRTLLRWEGAAGRQALLTLVLVLPALAAVKLHGAMVAATVFPIALWRLWATRALVDRWLVLVLAALASGLLGLSQYLHAWQVSGNPVFPLMNQIFRSPDWLPVPLVDPRWIRRFGPDLLYAMTFRSASFVEGYPGAIGFSALALSLAGVVAAVLFPRRAALLCLAVAVPPLLFVLPQIQYIRYLHFAMPLLLVVKAHALVLLAGLPFARLPAAGLGVALALGGLLVLPAGSWTVVAADLRAAYDSGRRQQVAAQTPARLANEVVNAMAPGSPRVVYGSLAYGANLRGWPIYTQWYNLRLKLALAVPADSPQLDATLDQLRADYVIAQIPPTDVTEARLVSWAERRGRLVGEVGPVRIWRLAP